MQVIHFLKECWAVFTPTGKIQKALEDSQKNNCILLVTGSFYLVSEVCKFIKR